MFKYVKFTKVETEHTVLEFRGGDEVTKVHHFDVDVVAIDGADATKVDALIASQPTEIKCTVIDQAEFKKLVSDSAQLNRIRQIVKSKIAEKYDIADEIAMSKKAVDDADKVAYEAYVAECIAMGSALKAEIGY